MSTENRCYTESDALSVFCGECVDDAVGCREKTWALGLAPHCEADLLHRCCPLYVDENVLTMLQPLWKPCGSCCPPVVLPSCCVDEGRFVERRFQYISQPGVVTELCFCPASQRDMKGCISCCSWFAASSKEIPERLMKGCVPVVVWCAVADCRVVEGRFLLISHNQELWMVIFLPNQPERTKLLCSSIFHNQELWMSLG